MRNTVALAMAPFIGRGLTQETASEILKSLPADGRPLEMSAFPKWQCGTVTLAAERVIDIIDELEPLHNAQWAETERYMEDVPVKPDIAAGLVDEMAGKLLQVTARVGGVLVGHMRMYVNSKSRHTGRLAAFEDTMYLRPEFRGGRTALRLLEFMEACLRVLKIEEAYLDDKVANPSAARLCEHMGYKIIANRRYKDLTKEHANVRIRT